MRTLFGPIWLVFALMVFGSTVQAREVVPTTRESVSLILNAQNLKQLMATSRTSEAQGRRARTCAIQRREKIAPTHCYAAIAGSVESEALLEIAKLDSECRTLSQNAIRLPALDAFTSPACREALELRAKDLAYAAARDALR